jgi:hypothetical protein
MGPRHDAFEQVASEMIDEIAVTQVIRPAAVIPESAARDILVELALRDVRSGGVWHASPNVWNRFDRPWDGVDTAGQVGAGRSLLLGSIQVAYGMPTRYEITIFRATITTFGAQQGWDVTMLCDEALAHGRLSLASCPRADLSPPPPVFRLR